MWFTLRKLFQLHHPQGFQYAWRDVGRRGFLHTQTEGHIFKNSHVGE